MKKLLYISMLFAFVLAFQSCEKEVVQKVDSDDPFVYDESQNRGNRGGGEEGKVITGGITDPDEDPDYDSDTIVDPDEDEDYDKDGK